MGISIADNFNIQSKKPLDGRNQFATLALMKAVTDSNIYEGCEAYCVETDKYYKFKSTNTVDETTGKWRERESGGTSDYTDLTNKPSINDVTLSGNKTTSDLGLQAEMQLSTMPTAGVSYLGKTVQYVGATGNGYTHNYFYECVSDGEATPTYSWQQTNVQASSGGGGGGHTIEDSEGTDLTQRDTLQFGTGFNATDDSTNEKTVITPDVMQSGDMDDVLTPLPSVQPRYHTYSTTEQIVGYWVDRKPIYERCFSTTFSDKASDARFYVKLADYTDSTLDFLFVKGMVKFSTGDFYAIDSIVTGKKGTESDFANSCYITFSADNDEYGIVVRQCYSSSAVSGTIKVAVQYTKTAD